MIVVFDRRRRITEQCHSNNEQLPGSAVQCQSVFPDLASRGRRVRGNLGFRLSSMQVWAVIYKAPLFTDTVRPCT